MKTSALGGKRVLDAAVEEDAGVRGGWRGCHGGSSDEGGSAALPSGGEAAWWGAGGGEGHVGAWAGPGPTLDRGELPSHRGQSESRLSTDGG